MLVADMLSVNSVPGGATPRDAEIAAIRSLECSTAPRSQTIAIGSAEPRWSRSSAHSLAKPITGLAASGARESV